MADWSEIEVELIIADYFQMLQKEISGISYSKTEHRNKLQRLLNSRSKGSIEFKHQNISAGLIKNGLPYIKGYKPRWNYQQLLDEKILNYVSEDISIEKKFNDFANSKIIIQPKEVHFKNWNVEPPEKPDKSIVKEPSIKYYKPIKRNYLELEQNNRSVGESGEKLVYEYEKWRLINAGFPRFAEQVKWISREEGDGAGYDILSKNKIGNDIYIEVKTTSLGKETPIFFSKRENDFSNQKRELFNLYRVFNVKEQPKMFCLNGRFQDICTAEVFNFKGFF
jgi:hypothetical protein